MQSGIEAGKTFTARTDSVNAIKRRAMWNLCKFLLFVPLTLLPQVCLAQPNDKCRYIKDEQQRVKFVCDDDGKFPRYRQPQPDSEFRGYNCTDDCSGHKAGYNWALKKGITDPEQCGGRSMSFVEGCRAAAMER